MIRPSWWAELVLHWAELVLSSGPSWLGLLGRVGNWAELTVKRLSFDEERLYNFRHRADCRNVPTEKVQNRFIGHAARVDLQYGYKTTRCGVRPIYKPRLRFISPG